MIPRLPGVDDVVRRVLEHEAGGARDAEALASAAERACHKLAGELETLVGRGGACALFGRAVGLSKREFPSLATVRLHPDAPLSFDALRESLRGLGAAEVEAASASLLANLLGVLINLLGEDLGLRPVMSVWPNLLPEAGSPDSGETEE